MYVGKLSRAPSDPKKASRALAPLDAPNPRTLPVAGTVCIHMRPLAEGVGKASAVDNVHAYLALAMTLPFYRVSGPENAG